MMISSRYESTQVGDLFHRIFNQNERALIRIGYMAYRSLVSLARDKRLFGDVPEVTRPREINDVLNLIARRTIATTNIYFRSIAAELRYPTANIHTRRCVELPKLFEILHICRNKRSHNVDISEHWLGVLCSTMLAVVELAHDQWLTPQEREAILQGTRAGLAFILSENDRRHDGDDDNDVNLQARLETKEASIRQLTEEKNELNAKLARLNVEPNVSRQIDDARTAIIGGIEEVNQTVNNLASYIYTSPPPISGKPEELQGDAIADDIDSHSVENDQFETSHDSTTTRSSSLTREMARQRCRTALRELKKKLPHLPYDVNIFHPAIVDEALEETVRSGELTPDGWRQLLTVRKRIKKDEQNIEEQMTLDGGIWQEKMMDIYNRFARSLKEK